MVAAPESVQAQVAPEQQVHEQQKPPTKLASKDSAAPSANLDDLTVVDHQDVPSPAPLPYHVTSHKSNFNPTPARQPQTNLPPREVAKLIPCRYFPQGTCLYGDLCIFSHRIPGVAGSPGVALSSSGKAQHLPNSTQSADPQIVLHQQVQHFLSQQDEHLDGMPMYCPEQHFERYGYLHHHQHHHHHHLQQHPFSPQRAFYPFPQPFYDARTHHYPQAPPPPPQAFYLLTQAQHQARQTSSTTLSSESHAFIPASTEHTSNPALASISPQSRSTSPVASASPSRDDSSALSPPGTSPLFSQPAAAGQTDHAPAQSQNATSSMSPSSADQATLPPLHTFLQFPQNDFSAPNELNGSTSPSEPASATPPANGDNYSNGKTAPRDGIIGPNGMPHFANGPQGRGPMVGPAGGFGSVNNGKIARRSFPARLPRPPCSFFEANRCRNRDACPFQHLLPDGSDARLLGQGWVGADGRTHNPEEKGGLPATWLANSNWKKTDGNRGLFRNGVQNWAGPFSKGAFRQQRNRFEEEQARLRADTQAQVAAAGHNGVAGESSSGIPDVSSVLAKNGSRLHPRGGAPQLVAAIHGLTRRIPPVQTRDVQASHLPVAAPNGSKLTNGDRKNSSSAPSRAAQRVPSGEDFPALTSGTLSPSLESSVAQPEGAAASQPSESPAAVALEASAEAQHIDDPSSGTAVAASDFVMLNHSDASASDTAGNPSIKPSSGPIASAPVLGTASMTAPSRIVGSFASAAARGASIVLPEKSKKASSSSTPTLATAATSTGPEPPAAAKDGKESSASRKGGKPDLKKHASSTTASSTTPVAVKA